MRAAKTVEIGFVKTVAQGIRSLRLAGGPDAHHHRSPVSPATDGFDKRGGRMHPQWAMTTAMTRAAGLSGLILLVVIFILP
jgi:hypothetical protein